MGQKFLPPSILNNINPTSSHFVLLSNESENSKQALSFANLTPGKKNVVRITLKNETGADLNIEKVSMSCGCMVVAAFESFVSKQQQRELSVTIDVGMEAVVQKREISFAATDGRVWYVEMDCFPLQIFEKTISSFGVGSENQDVERTLRLTYTRAAVESGLIVKGSNSLACSLSGVFAAEARIHETELGVDLTLVPDWNRFGLKKVISESVEISSPRFRATVVVEFQNESRVRISPTACSVSKLLAGGQRFFIAKDLGVGELSVRAVTSQGVKKEVEMAVRSRFRSGEMVEVTSENRDEVAGFVSLEFFEKENPKDVVCNVGLVKTNIIEGQENED